MLSVSRMKESPTLELAKETDVNESSRNAGGAGKLPACSSGSSRTSNGKKPHEVSQLAGQQQQAKMNKMVRIDWQLEGVCIMRTDIS